MTTISPNLTRQQWDRRNQYPNANELHFAYDQSNSGIGPLFPDLQQWPLTIDEVGLDFFTANGPPAPPSSPVMATNFQFPNHQQSSYSLQRAPPSAPPPSPQDYWSQPTSQSANGLLYRNDLGLNDLSMGVPGSLDYTNDPFKQSFGAGLEYAPNAPISVLAEDDASISNQFSTFGDSYSQQSLYNPTFPFQFPSTTNDDLSGISSQSLRNFNPTSEYPAITFDESTAAIRAETYSNVKFSLPANCRKFKRLHLPRHCTSRPKQMEMVPNAEPEADTVQLDISVVLASAMRKPQFAEGILHRKAVENNKVSPRGMIEDLDAIVDANKANKTQKPQQLEEDRDIKICLPCIKRERARALRGKKVESDLPKDWFSYEQDRLVYLSHDEYMDLPPPSGESDSYKIELKLRIACYCRHQQPHSTDMGYCLVLTAKDHTGHVLAQGVSDTINVTDAKKNSVPPSRSASYDQLPNPSHY